ncbi:hypothetical protein LTR53_019027, partial [Teratosphaeriaceae sp. CCFEE 6253]
MGKPQRSPAAKFDDIPGKLPEGTVPEDVDRSSVAQSAIDRLNDLRPEHLYVDAIWRDLLSFTGTYRTFYSQATVYATLQKLSEEKRRSRFRLRDGKPRIGKTTDGVSWLDVDVEFTAAES